MEATKSKGIQPEQFTLWYHWVGAKGQEITCYIATTQNIVG
jgi:hypothetical protein